MAHITATFTDFTMNVPIHAKGEYNFSSTNVVMWDIKGNVSLALFEADISSDIGYKGEK